MATMNDGKAMWWMMMRKEKERLAGLAPTGLDWRWMGFDSIFAEEVAVPLSVGGTFIGPLAGGRQPAGGQGGGLAGYTSCAGDG